MSRAARDGQDPCHVITWTTNQRKRFDIVNATPSIQLTALCCIGYLWSRVNALLKGFQTNALYPRDRIRHGNWLVALASRLPGLAARNEINRRSQKVGLRQGSLLVN